MRTRKDYVLMVDIIADFVKGLAKRFAGEPRFDRGHFYRAILQRIAYDLDHPEEQ